MVLNRNKGEPDFIITNKEEQMLSLIHILKPVWG